jgi:hypothetical protein
VRTGSGHYHLAEVAVTLLQLYKDVFFLSVRGVFFGGEADVGEAQRVLSVGQIVDDKLTKADKEIEKLLSEKWESEE